MSVRTSLGYSVAWIGLLLSVSCREESRTIESRSSALMREPSMTLSSELHTAFERAASVDVIVSLRPSAAQYSSTREQRATAIATRLQALQRSLGAQLTHARSFRHTHAFSGTLTRAGVTSLLQHPEVLSVQLDRRGRTQLLEAVPSVQAALVHSTYQLTGKGVRIAVLDTGIEADHPDLRDAVVAQRCFVRGACQPSSANEGADATDDNGHGTSIAGVIASRGRVSAPGFAPEAELVAVKVLAADGTGQESDWVAGLDWIYDNLDRLQVKLVNLSFVSERLFDDDACDRAAPALSEAITNLTSSGVVVFGASGNNGSFTQLSVPACNTGVIAVGATYDGDVGPMPAASGTFKRLIAPSFADCRDETTDAMRVTCYSNSSARLDLLAPGSPIVSDWIGGGTSLRGGTSYAAAAVTGIAALLLQCNAGLAPEALKSTLTDTGLPLMDARNGLSFPLVQAANAARQVCPELPDAGASVSEDAAVTAPPAAGSAAPAAASDAGSQQPTAAGARGVGRIALDGGTPTDAATSTDAASPSDAGEPIAPVQFTLPKRAPKPSPARASEGGASCTAVSPGHAQGRSAATMWATSILAYSAVRRYRRRRTRSR